MKISSLLTQLPVLLALLLLALLQFTLPEFLEQGEDARAHQRMMNLKQSPPDPSIVILGLDEEVFETGRFNRLEHANVIDILTRVGARQVFYDVLFDESREPAVDQILADAVARSRRVILAGAYQSQEAEADIEISRPKLIPELAQLVQDGRAQLGIINAAKYGEKSQATLVFWDQLNDPDKNPWGPGMRLCPGAAMLAAHHHLQGRDLSIAPASFFRGPVLRIPPYSVETLNTLESVDRKGNPLLTMVRIPIRFFPPATGPDGQPGQPGRIPVIPYLKVADQDPATLKFMKDKFVFVGETTRGDTDVCDTPRGKMKGVEIHAQIFDSILRDQVPHFPNEGTLFHKTSLALIATLCFFFARSLVKQPGLLRSLLLTVLALAFWEGLVYTLDRYDYFLPQTLGERSLAITAILCLFFRFLVSTRVLRTFIPAEIVDRVLRGEEITQGPVDATVMVTDIRGYTTLSESRTPAQVLQLLNDYHTETVALYEKFGGYVLNYQGDAQIILFGHPRKLADPALNAIRAGQAASTAVETLRQRWKLPEGQTFMVGAGICSGKVIIADLGGEHREYTVIGELVRKGHKLQSQSDNLGANIILDEETYARCQDKPDVVRRENVMIEGLPDPVTVYITDLIRPVDEEK